MGKSFESTPKKEKAGTIVPVEVSYGTEPRDPKYGLGGGNYTPKFEENGEVHGLGDSFGQGVFEQNGKFYFSSCHTGNPKKAFQIPENIARRIVDGMHSTGTDYEDPLVEDLWSSIDKQKV